MRLKSKTDHAMRATKPRRSLRQCFVFPVRT